MNKRGGHRDRISALPDELLHVILGFVGNAIDVAKTAVLSRRWRHVWVHASNLTFSDDDKHLRNRNRTIAPGHLGGFVDWVLAQRGETTIESLAIRISKNGSASPEQVNGWLRYAGMHVLKSLLVQLYGQTEQLAVDLPRHCRATSISLFLAQHSLQLPAAARYEALTDLQLFQTSLNKEAVPVAAGSNSLGDFVTSCCPSLRRLSLHGARALRQLVLRSESLQELVIFNAWYLQTLDVTASDLRIVSLNLCFHNPVSMDLDTVEKVARIVAPRLQEIGIQYHPRTRQPDLDIHGLTSVRHLKDLWLDMHGKYCTDQVGLWLLARCPGVEHVDVILHHWIGEFTDKGDLVDLTSTTKEGVGVAATAHLSNVRSMVLRARYFPACHLVSSMTSLLIRCSRLKLLDVRIGGGTSRDKCFCDDLEDKWEIPGKIGLEMLETVTITGFTGQDVAMKLVSLLFESSSSIQCMVISQTIRWIDIAYLKQEKIGKEVDENTTSMMGQKLIKVPYADRGCWYFVDQVFLWTCYTSKRA